MRSRWLPRHVIFEPNPLAFLRFSINRCDHVADSGSDLSLSNQPFCCRSANRECWVAVHLGIIDGEANQFGFDSQVVPVTATFRSASTATSGLRVADYSTRGPSL
jgi:hypothetical protein